MPNQDKLLFTPGPLTTSETVKQRMLHDLGSRDSTFIETVKDIRNRLLGLAGLSTDLGYEAILMQGSGTFGLESVVGSVIPPQGKLLVIINGAYGRRIAAMARTLGISVDTLECSEDQTPDLDAIADTLNTNPSITHVFVVHCETTTGILNPVQQIGTLVNDANRVFCVDAMSSFGAIPIDLEACHIDFLVSSANKCIEGVPGFSFILARKESLLATDGYARSMSFDLLAQWKGLERNGQFRFTPPTHTILAFHQALLELEEEGGVNGRAARYRKNHELLIQGMHQLGFTPYLDPSVQSIIITSFYYPAHPNFDFNVFYDALSKRGLVIYPGKLTQADCFRVGNIGQLMPEDIERLLSAIAQTLENMNIELVPS